MGFEDEPCSLFRTLDKMYRLNSTGVTLSKFETHYQVQHDVRCRHPLKVFRSQWYQ